MALPNPLSVVIIEDQPLIRKDIEHLLTEELDFTQVASCGKINEALKIIKEKSPDLLLLDINLPDGSAFDLLKQLHGFNFQIIFITAHKDFALKAIKHSAIDYLVKPIDQLEFKRALTKVRKWYLINSSKQETTKDTIAITTQQYLQIIQIEEILFCQSDKGYTTFFLSDGRKIISSKNLKAYESLLQSHSFIHPHQSYMVNARHVDRYLNNGILVLKNKMEIPVSTRRREEITNYFKGIR